MNKVYCDMCGDEIPRTEDIRRVKIEDVTGMPRMKMVECCVHCANKVKEVLVGRLT